MSFQEKSAYVMLITWLMGGGFILMRLYLNLRTLMVGYLLLFLNCLSLILSW